MGTAVRQRRIRFGRSDCRRPETTMPETTMPTTREAFEQAVAELGLTMTFVFVPWSHSRYKDERLPSLNWTFTLHRDGRPILTTDYSAGCGHCPAYKATFAELGGHDSVMRREKIHEQCETGRHRATALLPEFADVLRSLVLDSDVLDCGSFEEWAENLGYSRAVEAVAAYDAACDTYDARICGADGVPRSGEQRVAINRQAQQLSPRGDNCEGHRDSCGNSLRCDRIHRASSCGIPSVSFGDARGGGFN